MNWKNLRLTKEMVLLLTEEKPDFRARYKKLETYLLKLKWTAEKYHP